MKSITFIGLLISTSVLYMSTVNAQISSSEVAQSSAINNLTTILNNASTEASPESLQNELIAAINLICKDPLDNTLSLSTCSASQIEQMLTAVTTVTGSNSPQLVSFLASLAAYGIDPDAITIAAILSDIDPTIASQATAAGKVPTPATITLPLLFTPSSGSGGSGGDTGISEVGN